MSVHELLYAAEVDKRTLGKNKGCVLRCLLSRLLQEENGLNDRALARAVLAKKQGDGGHGDHGAVGEGLEVLKDESLQMQINLPIS
jgi:hypothetical protein